MMKYKKLKEIRESKGYNQQTVATFSDMALSTYADKESGKTKFKVEEFEKVVKFLNIDPLELLELD
ncbi:helix-turn-helix domain-containing protein [Metaclostridioides mangenotii]|uniref:helix-turn-helix domain-containing protein n=1 Tax=Metaclostridioides mangenotii TaxID=1540 RepID=UPI001F23D816|nr:helix-turn-helix transcriptional regulator [Clostridioides mangenotii]